MVYPSRTVGVQNGCGVAPFEAAVPGIWNKTMVHKNFTLVNVLNDTDLDPLNKNSSNQLVITMSNVIYDVGKSNSTPLGVIAI